MHRMDALHVTNSSNQTSDSNDLDPESSKELTEPSSSTQKHDVLADDVTSEEEAERLRTLRIAFVGNVDSGKSSLIGTSS